MHKPSTMEYMMKTKEKKLIKLIKEEYSARILNLYRESVREILESDMVDKEGHVLLSPGLKVTHKKSGYEYTVDHVEGNGENAVVFLRHPETPRFKPPVAGASLSEGEENIDLSKVDLQKIGGFENEVQTPQSSSTQDPLDIMKQQPKGSLLKITKTEFEKEYEVK